MILKGSQRAGGADLATHLLNAFDNEKIRIAQIRGTVADDLHGAFAEYEAIAAGTRCKQPLYSLSINPGEPLTRAQYRAAIDHIEEQLGLTGQPRAVIFHEKNAREHCHVVWSRIDSRQMRAIHMSHDRMKLRTAARELARAYGHELPEGLAKDRGGDRFDRRDMTLAEKARAERSGITPDDRRAAITAAFRQSDSAESFKAALADKGYVLARGDRRGFVVVDSYGDVHSLARQIDGAKTRDVKAKLAPLTPEQLPSVAQAREQIRGEHLARDRRVREQIKARRRQHHEALASRQAERRRRLQQRQQELLVRHAGERLALHAAQKAEARRPYARAARTVFGMMNRLPGLRSVLAPLARNPHLNPEERHKLENEALARRHARERLRLDRRFKALRRVEARERCALETKLLREARNRERSREARIAEAYRVLKEVAAEITQARQTPARERAARQARGQATQQPDWEHRPRQLARRYRMRNRGHGRER